jgi:hypothetical protein
MDVAGGRDGTTKVEEAVVRPDLGKGQGEGDHTDLPGPEHRRNWGGFELALDAVGAGDALDQGETHP